jgi:hypothetical protein
MTSYNGFTDRNRDQQDGYERGLWGELQYVENAGAVMKIRGTGDTLDEEVPLLNTGYAFNVPKDFNTEIVMLAVNSDTNQKMAFTTLPRDQQRAWPEKSGGIQHPINKEKFIQLDDNRIWLRDGEFALGNNQEITITVSGGTVQFKVAGDLDIQSDKLMHNGVNIGDNHVHSQPADSHGDAEANTNGPQDP